MCVVIVFPPLPVCMGTKPRKAANCLPDLNSEGSASKMDKYGQVGHCDYPNAGDAEQMPGVFGCLCQTDCLIGDAINPCTFSKNAFNIERECQDFCVQGVDYRRGGNTAPSLYLMKRV